jgi:hypothetical protein
MRINTGLIAGSLSVVCLLGACSQQQRDSASTAEIETAAPPVQQVVLAPPITTIKPGASVSFSTDRADPIAVGENGSVTLTVNEGYPFGVLHLKASGNKGLNVFGAEKEAQKDMSSGASHQWRIDYSADADGVYYINILATATPEDGFSEMRAHSVRVQVGDWQSAQAKVDAARKTTITPDGEQMVILEAEETIE